MTKDRIVDEINSNASHINKTEEDTVITKKENDRLHIAQSGIDISALTPLAKDATQNATDSNMSTVDDTGAQHKSLKIVQTTTVSIYSEFCPIDQLPPELHLESVSANGDLVLDTLSSSGDKFCKPSNINVQNITIEIINTADIHTLNNKQVGKATANSGKLTELSQSEEGMNITSLEG